MRQRPRLFAASRLVVQPILAVLATSFAVAAEREHALPAPPRALVVRGDLALACMVQEGLAVASLDPESSTGLRLESVVELPTLHAVILEDDRALLAGRQGYLVLMDFADRTAPREISRWPQEGIPVHLAFDGGRLRVAAGPAGLQFSDWTDTTAAPVLRARYAFCDFMKQSAVGPTGAIFVADNMDGGVQALEVTDPERPRRLFGKTVGDFVDCIEVTDTVAVAGARRVGWYLFDGSGTNREPLGMVPLPQARGAEAEAVLTLPQRRVALAERTAGARVLRLGPKEAPASVTVEARYEGASVISIATLEDGRLLLGTEGPGLVIWQPGAAPARP